MIKQILFTVGLAVTFIQTQAQTPYLVKDINPGTGSPWPLNVYYVERNGLLYMNADNGTDGEELWKSDGTAAGTVMIKDIYPGSGSSLPANLTNALGSLFFTADDGNYGTELWKTDGTAAKTFIIKDINPGASSSSPIPLMEYNGALYFMANDGTNTGLWKTDGTGAGTVFIKYIGGFSYPQLSVVYKGELYLFFVDEVWKTNGTANGTQLVKDFYTPDITAYFIESKIYNNTLFFICTIYDSGNPTTKLYKTDGTPGGTVLVSTTAARNLVVYNGFMYCFHAGQSDLYKTDGTVSGTSLVKNITGVDPSSLMQGGNNLYFSAGYSTANGYELWKSNGTAAGTLLLKDIAQGTTSSSPSYLTYSEGNLYFAAKTTNSGVELYKSDGTTVGTVMVKDIYPGATDSNPRGFTSANGLVFFRANTPNEGRELWAMCAGPVPAKPTISKNGNVLSSSNGSSYQWYKDGVIIPGATAQQYTATQAGVYTVKVGAGGCQSSASDPVTVTVTGIGELTSIIADMNVYPNPFKDEFTISYTLNNAAQASIEILDITGKELAVLQNEQFTAQGTQHYNVHSNELDLKQGVYFVKITIAGNTNLIRKITMVK